MASTLGKVIEDDEVCGGDEGEPIFTDHSLETGAPHVIGVIQDTFVDRAMQKKMVLTDAVSTLSCSPSVLRGGMPDQSAPWTPRNTNPPAALGCFTTRQRSSSDSLATQGPSIT